MAKNATKNTISSAAAALGLTIVPCHIAIVMDGNGRWAIKQGKSRIYGHQQGAATLKKLLATVIDLGVQVLSVYAFSTENWGRPQKEVAFLMNLFQLMLERELKNLNQAGVRLKCIGRIHELDPALQKKIKRAEGLTEKNHVIQLNLMLNYGARAEILDACQQLVTKAKNGDISTVDEALFTQHLLTAGCPDPDVWIRTGGAKRISNFMLWQMSYSELFFVDKYWPDFKASDLIEIFREFQHRERRFGGLND